MRPVLTIALVCGVLAGCCSNSFVIADEYYVFLTERQVIYFDTGDDSRHLYASLIPATDDDVQLGLIGSLGMDSRFKYDSNSLLLDIRLTAKSAREYMDFYPESLLAVIDADTLVLNGHDDWCNSCSEECGFATSFDFNPRTDLPPGVSPDSVWLALDLSRALKYKGQRLVSDVIWGKLPSAAFDRGVPTPEGTKLGLLDEPTASGGVLGLYLSGCKQPRPTRLAEPLRPSDSGSALQIEIDRSLVAGSKTDPPYMLCEAGSPDSTSGRKRPDLLDLTFRPNTFTRTRR